MTASEGVVIVGVGSESMGDDAAGPAVVRRLRARGKLAPSVRLEITRDPTQLVALFDGCAHAVVVDAVLDPERVGSARRVAPDALSAKPWCSSSHGIDVVAALGLMQRLAERPPPQVDIVAVSIADAKVAPRELSAEVDRGVDAAVTIVEALVAAAGTNAHAALELSD
ncbi:MAG TPA: hydrogenase maturation protease [Polyangiaceae bacterium]|mgnify:CR=1 FL=1|nr:hydrogenase maturation protease [Polyangiaceae bacterium]